ncbi:carbon-nitrogen hydrolase family protein [Halobacteriales archaeon Cl-PHB]
MPHHVAACQFEPEVDAVEANCETVRDLAVDLPDEVALAVFPELCVTGYDLDVATEAATPVPGPVTDDLVDVAAESETHLVVGLPERDGDAVYNDLVYVSPDGVEAVYRKQYPWGDEADTFATGDGPVTAETPVGRVGFLLCYDLNFPEAALAYDRRGVDVLLVSAAWRESYRDDWDLLARSRALDGTCYVAASNHAGDQSGREHLGGSLLAGPDGSVLDRAGDGQATVSAAVDADALTAARDRNPVQETRTSRES